METILKKLNAAAVRYVVIGGQAMQQEGMPRFTLDRDLFVPPRDLADFDRIDSALADELDVDRDQCRKPEIIFSAREPVRLRCSFVEEAI